MFLQPEMTKMLSIVTACLLIFNFPNVSGFSNGESIQTASERLYCGRPPLQRLPFHMSDRCSGSCRPQTGEPPYHIVIEGNSTTYWDEDVRIILETINEDSRWRVNGFSIFALDEYESVVGVWAPDNIVQLTCGSNSEGMTAVHESADSSRRKIIVRWTPAGRNLGVVTFRAIVVHSQDIYWSVSSDYSLSPARTGEDGIDISVHFTEVLNGTLVRENIDLENIQNIDDFEASFRNRLESGWDPDDFFGAFNRNITIADFFLEGRRKGTFTSPFSSSSSDRTPSTRFGENSADSTTSIVDRLLNGGFPGMTPQFGQRSNGWNPLGMLGMGNTNQNQNMPQWMQGNNGNMNGNQNMFGNQNNMFGNQNNMFGNQNNMFGNQNNMFGNQNNMFGNQNNMFGNQFGGQNMFGNMQQNGQNRFGTMQQSMMGIRSPNQQGFGMPNAAQQGMRLGGQQAGAGFGVQSGIGFGGRQQPGMQTQPPMGIGGNPQLGMRFGGNAQPGIGGAPQPSLGLGGGPQPGMGLGGAAQPSIGLRGTPQPGMGLGGTPQPGMGLGGAPQPGMGLGGRPQAGLPGITLGGGAPPGGSSSAPRSSIFSLLGK